MIVVFTTAIMLMKIHDDKKKAKLEAEEKANIEFKQFTDEETSQPEEAKDKEAV